MTAPFDVSKFAVLKLTGGASLGWSFVLGQSALGQTEDTTAPVEVSSVQLDDGYTIEDDGALSLDPGTASGSYAEHVSGPADGTPPVLMPGRKIQIMYDGVQLFSGEVSTTAATLETSPAANRIGRDFTRRTTFTVASAEWLMLRTVVAYEARPAESALTRLRTWFTVSTDRVSETHLSVADTLVPDLEAGTATMLELARAFTSATKLPLRSVALGLLDWRNIEVLDTPIIWDDAPMVPEAGLDNGAEWMTEVSYAALDVQTLTPESASVVVGDTRLTGGLFTETTRTGATLGTFILGESQVGVSSTRLAGFRAPGVVDVLGVPTAVARVSQTFSTDDGGTYAASMEFAPYLRLTAGAPMGRWPAPITLAATRHAGFPGLAWIPTPGPLVVVYRQGTDHQATYDGDIFMRRSVTDGYSWLPAVRIATHTGTGYDMRDPSLVATTDGGLTLTYFERHAGFSASAWSVRSVDGGATWEPRTIIAEAALLSAPAVERPPSSGVTGRLLQPVYGAGRCRVFFSDDVGATWAELSTIATTAQCGSEPQEPWIVRDPTFGVYVCMMRTASNTAYRSESNDHGLTWSTPTPAFVANSRIAMARTSSDGVLHGFYRAFPDFWMLHHRTSTDLGVTWSAPDTVDSHQRRSTYAAPADVGGAFCALAYAYENAAYTTSRVEFTRR